MAGGGSVYLGRSFTGGATGNVVRIDGGGVAGSAVLTNAGGGIIIGYNDTPGTGFISAGHKLIVTNGGNLFSGNIT